MELNDDIKTILLKIARESIEAIFSGAGLQLPDFELFPILNSRSGAFVTLTINKKLRGCIGYIISDRPLHETIKDAAVQASQHDPRFAPVKEEELDKIKIEISILSEPFPMVSYDDIVLGKHGLILEENGQRGLLLPQVPIEHKMDREEYLEAICNKTGFHSSFWKEKQLNIKLFTATIFSEG